MKPWHINDPQVFQELKRQIESKYATLCVFVENDVVYIRGCLIIEAPDGRELDNYSIEIRLPDDYPNGIPIVKETGGRLPRILDRHILSDGVACLFLRDERYKYYPQGSTIIDFIDTPVKNFFLWQVDYDLNGGKSNIGERGHGVKGIIEFYSEELKTNNISIICRFADYLSAKKIKVNWKCYCGSGKQLKDCHLDKLQDLRIKIARGVAKKSFNQIKAEKLKQNNISTGIPNL
jgi:hypothetical protein